VDVDQIQKHVIDSYDDELTGFARAGRTAAERALRNMAVGEEENKEERATRT
jgi:hypothetical protein